MTFNGDDNISQNIGIRIHNRRKEWDIQQHALAKAIGISPQQLSEYEQGQKRISAVYLYNIAHHLQIPITYFFER